jgi:hypothetical protein
MAAVGVQAGDVNPQEAVQWAQDAGCGTETAQQRRNRPM